MDVNLQRVPGRAPLQLVVVGEKAFPVTFGGVRRDDKRFWQMHPSGFPRGERMLLRGCGFSETFVPGVASSAGSDVRIGLVVSFRSGSFFVHVHFYCFGVATSFVLFYEDRLPSNAKMGSGAVL